MLKNNNIPPEITNPSRIAPNKLESALYDILFKIVERKARGRVDFAAFGQSKRGVPGSPERAANGCDEAHCMIAAIESNFGLMSLRPNHTAGRGAIVGLASDCLSRCCDWSLIENKTGDQPTRCTDSHGSWERHAVIGIRPAPHAMSFTGSEASCVE